MIIIIINDYSFVSSANIGVVKVTSN